MMNLFQRLFGKEAIAVPARGLLGLYLDIGSVLNILAFYLLEESLLIGLPGKEYTTTATSRIDLDGESQIFCYYASREELLRISITDGSNIGDIDDIKFLVYAEGYGISRKKHWQPAISPPVIGAPTLSQQEERWQHSFNEEESGNIEPVYILERVKGHQHAIWNIHNFTIDYQRQITDDTWEYPLLSGEGSFSELGESK